MQPYIMENCIICGTCMDICPIDAVEEFKDYYRISNRCDECGKCVKACPNFAIAKTLEIGQRLESRSHTEMDGDDS